MSGAETDTNTVREALMERCPPAHDPPCDHGVCAPYAALSRLSGRVTELEQALRAERVTRHVANLEAALELAESDPLYAVDLRPLLARLNAALAGSAGQEQA